MEHEKYYFSYLKKKNNNIVAVILTALSIKDPFFKYNQEQQKEIFL